jgi:2-polyprenyl-6-methoxyphenol hydroxylase-like FAD-dependent oxidoreductase
VCVVDRAPFPSDTPSTHVFQENGAAVLARLGVLDRVLATGAPALDHLVLLVDGLSAEVATVKESGAGVGALCVRRPALDSILLETAAEAGAQIRTGACVTGLVRSEHRVLGVETDEGSIHASIVIGADGRNSTVANLVGARKYNVIPSERVLLWAYYDDARYCRPRLTLGRLDGCNVMAAPTDGGGYMVGVGVPAHLKAHYVADLGPRFDETVACWSIIDNEVIGTERNGPVRVVGRYESYLRDATGPGWALVGDAGLFKDPAGLQGMSDAFRHAEELAAAVVRGLDGERTLASCLTDWWRWRDVDSLENYWFCADLGKAGPMEPLVAEILRELAQDPERRGDLAALLNGSVTPSDLFSPASAWAASNRIIERGHHSRREVLGWATRTLGTQLHRKRVAHRPHYAEEHAQPGSNDQPPEDPVTSGHPSNE